MNDDYKSNSTYACSPERYKSYEALNIAAAVQLWTDSYALSGLMIRDVTAKKAREIAATELSCRLAEGLREKIQANMKVLPASVSMDAVRYEVQLVIHTREEFKQAVRAEAKKLLETALS